MHPEIYYRLPERIFLSPRLHDNGVQLSDIKSLLEASLAVRDRFNLHQGEIDHPSHGVIAWSLEVPSDQNLMVTHFYLKCRRPDELFFYGEFERPYWEEPGYDHKTGKSR